MNFSEPKLVGADTGPTAEDGGEGPKDPPALPSLPTFPDFSLLSCAELAAAIAEYQGQLMVIKNQDVILAYNNAIALAQVYVDKKQCNVKPPVDINPKPADVVVSVTNNPPISATIAGGAVGGGGGGGSAPTGTSTPATKSKLWIWLLAIGGVVGLLAMSGKKSAS